MYNKLIHYKVYKMVNWSNYPNFSKEEFACKETGECDMNGDFMALLQAIRTVYGRPMVISSGYRSKNHSVEKGKKLPGEHTFGLAADILINGMDALTLVHIALSMGIRRIGINQVGEMRKRYIHLGMGNRSFDRMPPAIWSY